MEEEEQPHSCHANPRRRTTIYCEEQEQSKGILEQVVLNMPALSCRVFLLVRCDGGSDELVSYTPRFRVREDREIICELWD